MPSKLQIILKHIPNIVTICASVYAGAIFINTSISAKLDNVVFQARQPTYLTTLYTLKKQNEKLRTDPEDLKTTDIELLTIMCSGDFGKKYLPMLPENQRLDAEETCKNVKRMYLKRSEIH